MHYARPRLSLAALLITLPMLFGILTIPLADHADAAPDRTCRSLDFKMDKATKWADRMTFWDPDQGVIYSDDQMRSVTYLLIADVRYQWCPRGKKRDLVRPKWLRFCYSQVNEQGRVIGRFILFDGWTFNAKFDDDDKVIDPPAHKVNEEGDANCEYQRLNYSKLPWLFLDESPGYKVDATVNINLKPDKTFKMRRKGTPYRFIRPKYDADISAIPFWYTGT